MTRDEVLDAVELAACEHDAHAVGLRLADRLLAAKWHECESEKLRAAAELIRAGGWRPMNTAPRDGRDVPVLVKLGGTVEWRQLFASSGGDYWVNHGDGHLYRESECIAWFELPEPPAREVENG